MSAQRGNVEDETLVAEAIASALLNVRVAGIGVVTEYDSTKKVAKVQPVTRRPLETDDGDVVQETPDIVQNVLVAAWGAASLSANFDLAPGDAVLLVYLDYSPILWRKRGQVSDTPDTTKHGPSYPVAIPFYRPGGGPASDTTNSIGIPGSLRLRFEVDFIGAGAASDFVAMAAKCDARFQAIETALNALTLPVSGATAGPNPTAITPGSSVASSNLKAV